MKDDSIEKLAKLIPEESRIGALATYLGCAAGMTLFIGEHSDFLQVNDEIRYLMALTAMGMLMLEEDLIGIIDLDKIEMPESQRFVHVVKELYEYCKLKKLL